MSKDGTDVIKALKEAYVKPSEAAKIAGVTRATIYTWVRTGKISSDALHGMIIYRPSLDKFVKARKAFMGYKS